MLPTRLTPIGCNPGYRFDGALDLHFGLTKEQLYEDFNQFMIDNPSPPEGFFPTQPLTELVDFWSIESG